MPDSILSNPGLAFIRRWLLLRAYVIASIDLPRETFSRSDTHTMTSVLILQKFTKDERKLATELGHALDYEVFMAVAEKVGCDLRGQPVFLRTPEGEEIFKKVVRKVPSRNLNGDVIEISEESEEPIIDDDLPQISDLFSEWLKEKTTQRWMHG